MNSYKIFLDETGDTTNKEIVRKGVIDYNFPYLGAWETKPVGIYIKDDSSRVIAGVCARYIPGELVDIDYFWVHENHRKEKHGTKLMKAVEDFAKKHKIPCINLYTMEFQALDFYKKQGFTLLATIPNWAKNYDAHFMRKVLN